MIPMWMVIRVPRGENQTARIYLPVFLGWILLLALAILLLPVWLIATLFARAMGYGWIGWVVIPLIFNTLWHLQGLIVDVESEEEHIYMEFI